MEIACYTVEFYLPKESQKPSVEISAFEKVHERIFPSDLTNRNIEWYSEYGIKKITETRAYAIEYYKAFLDYRIGKRSYFGNWDNEMLTPVINSYNASVSDVWVAIFLNIMDENLTNKKRIEITGTFDRGKWQLFRLSEELKIINEFTGSNYHFELPFFYFSYPTDIETLLLNNRGANTIIYDLNFQIIELATNNPVTTIQKSFESRDPAINRKMAISFAEGFVNCFNHMVSSGDYMDSNKPFEPSLNTKFIFQGKECILRRTLSAKMKNLFGFSDLRRTELNYSAIDKSIFLFNDFDERKNIVQALVEEVELYEFAGQKRETEKISLGEVGELSSTRRNQFGFEEHDPCNIYFRPNKIITYTVLKNSETLLGNYRNA